MTETAGVRVRRLGRPGDLGWMIMAHGELYASEYDWDSGFESLVARIVADFAEDHDPDREAGWIAEQDGNRVGCILCVTDPDDASGSVAKLRILLVDPSARGQGVGQQLVDACLGFATTAGYQTITLWTNDVLTSARKIYQSRGFELIKEDHHHSFGHDLVGQYWSKQLTPAESPV